MTPLRIPFKAWHIQRRPEMRGRRFRAVRFFDIRRNTFHYGLIEHGIEMPPTIEVVDRVPKTWRPDSLSRRFIRLRDGRIIEWEPTEQAKP